jgi:hypothetical protein
MTLLTIRALTLVGLMPLLASSSQPALVQPAFENQETPAEKAGDPDEAKTIWEYLSDRYDANDDGKIDKEE